MAVVSFFTPEGPRSIAEFCATLGCDVPAGIDPARLIHAVDSIEKAVAGDLTFAVSGKMRAALARLRDVTVLCTEGLADAVPAGCAAIVHKHPAQMFHRFTRAFYPASLRSPDFSGLAARPDGSFVHPSARLERGVVVSAGVVIGAHVEVGAGTRISTGARIAPGSTIGRNCDVGMNAVVQCALIGDGVIIGSGTVIGHDGFGYVPGPAGLDKIPQLGRVILQNRVEIGANCCVDRGALDDTVIGEGTKIDNLVQIAHNVRIGRHCVIAAMCGIAGSVTVGDGTMLGGQVGVVDHISIGRNVRLAAMTGVLSDIDDNSALAGMPARPVRAFFREALEVKKLAERRVHVKAAQSGDNDEE